MQSITNAANAAKAAVFGTSEAQTQSGTEPVSGVTGSGTSGEPYDAGNITGKWSCKLCPTPPKSWTPRSARQPYKALFGFVHVERL